MEDWDGVDEIHPAWEKVMMTFIIAVTVFAIGVLFYGLSDQLIGLFTQDQEIYALAEQLLFLTIFLQPVTALNTILFHSLKAVGDVYVPVVISQVVMWGISLPLAYWLCVPMEMGVVGLWYVFIFEEALKGACMLYRWLRGSWLQSQAKVSDLTVTA